MNPSCGLVRGQGGTQRAPSYRGLASEARLTKRQCISQVAFCLQPQKSKPQISGPSHSGDFFLSPVHLMGLQLSWVKTRGPGCFCGSTS